MTISPAGVLVLVKGKHGERMSAAGHQLSQKRLWHFLYHQPDDLATNFVIVPLTILALLIRSHTLRKEGAFQRESGKYALSPAGRLMHYVNWPILFAAALARIAYRDTGRSDPASALLCCIHRVVAEATDLMQAELRKVVRHEDLNLLL